MTLSDIKYALRLLLKSPWFTLLTVVVLAGGLAISIYTFAGLSTLIYKDLPLPDGGSIVQVRRIGNGPFDGPFDAYDLAQIRGSIRTLSQIGAYRSSQWAVIGDEGSNQSLISTRAEWNIFEFTRTQPLMGRGFVRDDQLEGAEPVAVISYGAWQTALAGEAAVIGKVVAVNGRSTRIVGVMPESYAFPITSEAWLPLSDRELDPTRPGQTLLEVYARLAPGVSAEAAEAELTALLKGVVQERAGADAANLVAADVTTFQRALWGGFGPRAFAVLNALAISILLLACVNAGNLMLVRTNERLKEIAVRIALGAPRWRLVAQMMLENVIICVVGGVAAVVLAGRAFAATNSFLSALVFESEMPYWWRWSLDGTAIVGAGVFILGTILLVSILPTFGLSSVDPNTVLRDGTHGARGRSAGRVSRALVTIEVVLISVVLLAGGTVAVFAYRMANFDWGIDTTDLYMTQIQLPADTYAAPEARVSFYTRLLEQVRNQSGVEAAKITRELGRTRFAVDDYERSSDYPVAQLVTMSETPSEVMTTLLEGRDFDSRDSAAGARTAIVSEALARIYWPEQSALGRRITVMNADGSTDERTVVGVVRNIRYDPTTANEASLAAIYAPLPQLTVARVQLVIKHRGGEAAVRNAQYAALRNVDAGVPAGRVMGYRAALDQATIFATTLTNLFIGCGAFAILLAMTGIYGLSSNTVVQRTYEIGLRRAMGASNRSIIALFLAQGGRQLAIGLLISALLSVGTLFFLAQMAELAAPVLAVMGIAVVLAVSGLVLVSIYVSVRGAIRREPSAALRHG
jgi:predicted permease